MLTDLLSRPEQKMVDTLLVTDLVYLSLTEKSAIAVISNDDDMWPGIRQALLNGSTIIHVHPIPGRATPTHFMIQLPAGYTQATLD
jgi:hypothetical protein